jgi:hypothetical protein
MRYLNIEEIREAIEFALKQIEAIDTVSGAISYLPYFKCADCGQIKECGQLKVTFHTALSINKNVPPVSYLVSVDLVCKDCFTERISTV